MASTTKELYGWVQRSTPHPTPHEFVPALENLVFASFISAEIGEQLVLALFDPCILVDNHGRVLIPTPENFKGIRELARKAAGIAQPEGGGWQIAQPHDGTWTEDLWVMAESGVSSVHVRGFSPSWTKLEKKTNGVETLPTEIHAILGLAEEAKKLQGLDVDRAMLAHVQAVIDHVRCRAGVGGIEAEEGLGVE